MILTAVGQALAQRAQRIQMELRDAARDLAEVATGGVGSLAGVVWSGLGLGIASKVALGVTLVFFIVFFN